MPAIGSDVPAKDDGTEHDGRDDRADVRFEQVGAHAGDVAHVVAHVVGDDGRVARIILGDAGLHLADEIGSDIGRLGIDAAADAGEERDAAGTEPKGGDERRRVRHFQRLDEHEEEDRHAQQSKAGHGEAHHCAAAERKAQRSRHTAGARRLRGPCVRRRSDSHADEAGAARRDRARQVCAGAEEPVVRNGGDQ